MFNSQFLFNKTLQDLKSKIDSGDQYDILMASSLIRKLLIDGANSLIYQVGEKDKKISFKVNKKEPLHIRYPKLVQDIKFWSIENGLDPDVAIQGRDYNPQLLNLDLFLKCPVMFVNGELITIRDLVKHLSDKEGGVHKQKTKIKEEDMKNILLHELGQMININNLPAGLNILRSISIIVYRDLSIFIK